MKHVFVPSHPRVGYVVAVTLLLFGCAGRAQFIPQDGAAYDEAGSLIFADGGGVHHDGGDDVHHDGGDGVTGDGPTRDRPDSSSLRDTQADGPAADMPSPLPSGAVFISPSGSDRNPGTQERPWKTWSHALSKLGPGDTLVALAGVYGVSTATGALQVNCSAGGTTCAGGPCLNGTSSAPITVMSYPERGAFLQGEVGAADRLIYLKDCSHWILAGLRVEGVDDADAGGYAVVQVRDCDNVTLKRMLGARANRYFNSSVFAIEYSTNVLVEECEAYDFHRAAVSLYRASEITVRRNYFNARLRPNLSGGHVSYCYSPGIDANSRGVYMFGASKSTIENNVAEELCVGFSISPSGAMGDDNKIAGNMVLGTFRTGYSLSSDCNDASPCTDPARIAERNHYLDNVATGGVMGYYFRGAIGTQLEHASAINYSGAGYRFDEVPENAGLASTVAISTALAVTSTGEEGFVVIAQKTWSLRDCNAYGNQTSDYRTSGPVGASYDPQLGGCLVYIPAGTPGKAAVADGSDVGANIVFRTEDGTLTGEKLWDASTGAFPCGVPVPGLSDDTGFPDSACVNVHHRLHVGTSGCPIP
ncbi:MAG: right-handed parallel beta-helix repeat-containing protein [Deltaproteobacteria bacterium]|nr:right-handed parallel beta-helix repeat-containing protein [Deltaproteobacteria bacterium]